RHHHRAAGVVEHATALGHDHAEHAVIGRVSPQLLEHLARVGGTEVMEILVEIETRLGLVDRNLAVAPLEAGNNGARFLLLFRLRFLRLRPWPRPAGRAASTSASLV